MGGGGGVSILNRLGWASLGRERQRQDRTEARERATGLAELRMVQVDGSAELRSERLSQELQDTAFSMSTRATASIRV